MEITLEKINVRSDPLQVFLDSLRNPYTQKRYKNLLHTFLKLVPDQIYKEFLGKTPDDRTPSALAGIFVELARKDVDIVSDIIATYINGRQFDDIRDYVVSEGDRILISYGSEDLKEIQEQLDELNSQELIN